MSIKEVLKERKEKILKSKKRKAALAIGVVAILCVGIFIFKKTNNNMGGEIIEDVVETYSIPENEKVFMNGSIKPKESKSINVDAGYEITKLSVSNGQYVTKGTPLFTAKDQEVLNQISDLEKQISSSEDPNSIRSEINSLKNKSYKTTYAPISGQVYLEEEASANTEVPSSYMTIESVDYFMKGQVSEQDLPKISKNMGVDVYIFATEKDVRGTITSISQRPASATENQDMMGNSNLSYYDVTVDFESQDGLVNGYHIQASVQIDSANPKIPATCVLRGEDNKPFVYMVKNNQLVKQLIEIESENEDFVVIESGLSQKDSIVKFPTEDMKEGDEINSDAMYSEEEFIEGRLEISDTKVGM